MTGVRIQQAAVPTHGGERRAGVGLSSWIPRLGTYAIASSALISFVFAAAPGNDSWGAEHVPLLKYLPLELTAVATVFYAASDRRRGVHWTVRCYQLLMVFMLAGALITPAT